jgi:hypothetical protein
MVGLTGQQLLDFCARTGKTDVGMVACLAGLRSSEGDTLWLVKPSPDNCWPSYYPEGFCPTCANPYGNW